MGYPDTEYCHVPISRRTVSILWFDTYCNAYKSMNKHKIQILLASFVFAGLLLLAWHFLRGAKGLLQESPKQFASTPAASVIGNSVRPSPTAGPVAKNGNANAMEAAHDSEVKHKQGFVSLWIMTPITFYGKVVDQNGNPVAGANVLMTALDHPLSQGSTYAKQSDSNGLFTIWGIHGAALQVNVSKEGYYTVPESWGDFAYAARVGTQKPAHPDRSDPAVFVLRKMGGTERLIHQEKDIKVSEMGTPSTIDLRTGNTVGAHEPDIQFQTWISDHHVRPGASAREQRFDWRCVVSVPGGGLQVRGGSEFDFEAPSDGYQASDQIAESGTADSWTGGFSRNTTSSCLGMSMLGLI